MMQIVWPSGGASEHALVPLFCAPPGRFSITTDWPQRLESSSPTARMKMSLMPPALEVVNTRMVRFG